MPAPDFDSPAMLALFLAGGKARAALAGGDAAEVWLGMVKRDAAVSREELARARRGERVRRDVRMALWRAMGFEPEGRRA